MEQNKTSPFLRTKSTKPIPIKVSSGGVLPKLKSEDEGTIRKESIMLGCGRAGRRNTLPNIFPDVSNSLIPLLNRNVEKPTENNLPFLDSVIKTKNKLRQSFHGTLSLASPSKSMLRHHSTSGRKNVLSSSCDNSPVYKRTNFPPVSASFKTKQRSLECSRPTTPSEESSSGTSSLPRSTSESITNATSISTMEGLARQSLLAARVFHLIPVERARERNFLQGRIACTSLLGPIELEKVLPEREITIFIATWNMNGQKPPEELNDLFLPPELRHVPDIFAIATQESFPERFEWEVLIQETIGPTHVLFHSAVLGTLHLSIMIRRDLLWYCSIPEETNVSTRTAAAFRTKGAVAISFLLFGTSFLFICSHLTAHEERVKDRIKDSFRIIGSLELPKVLPMRRRNKDATQNFDFVFWSGDLNFRLEHERDDVVKWATFEQGFPSDGPLLLERDQLIKIMADGKAFNDFTEGPIMFPPTYKYDPGTNEFDTSNKRRTPSYTDRILFRSRNKNDLKCEKYLSVSKITTSDHKPVWGLYTVKIRPGKDTIPLAAGLFNRDVYLEGLKRRATAMDRRQNLSTFCSIQ